MKKTLFPSSTTILSTICCSGLKITFCLISIVSLVNILPLMPPSAPTPPTVRKLDDDDDDEDDPRDLAAGESSKLSQGMARFLGGKPVVEEVVALPALAAAAPAPHLSDDDEEAPLLAVEEGLRKRGASFLPVEVEAEVEEEDAPVKDDLDASGLLLELLLLLLPILLDPLLVPNILPLAPEVPTATEETLPPNASLFFCCTLAAGNTGG